MNNKKNTITNLATSILAQIITIALGLVIPRITLVGYGSEVNGLLNSVNQIIIYLTLFEAGVQAVAMQSLYNPVSINDHNRINRILSAVNISYRKTGIYYLLGLLGIAAVYPFLLLDSEISYLTAFLVILFSGLPNVILFLFQGKYRIFLHAEGKNYIITNLALATTVLTNVMKIILLSLGFDVVVVVFSTFIISLFQAIYVIVYFRRKYKWIDLSVEPDFTALSQKNFALTHQIAGLVFQNTDVLILTVFCGLKVVSVYSMYKLVVGHLNSIMNIPFNSISFWLGQTFNTDKSKFIKMIDAVEVGLSALTFAAYSVFIALMCPFLSLYTDGVTDIAYVDERLVILFAAVEILTFARVPMLNTINYAGHFKSTLPQTIIETTINLVISLATVYWFGIYGVLLGTVAALLYRTIEVIFYTNKKILNRKPIKTFSIYIVNLVLLVVFQIVYSLIGITINSYLSFFIVGAVLFLITLLLHMGTVLLLYKEERKMLMGIIKKKINRPTNREE